MIRLGASFVAGMAVVMVVMPPPTKASVSETLFAMGFLLAVVVYGATWEICAVLRRLTGSR